VIKVKTLSKYLVESTTLYGLVKGKFPKILLEHQKGLVELLTSSRTLTDQFNNDPGWEENRNRILNFCKKNKIVILECPDMVWHTEDEKKELPGPFTLGKSKLCSNIWGGDDSPGGLRDILGKTMWNNFDDIKKRIKESEEARKRYMNCLCDIDQVICAIENNIDSIITCDGDIKRSSDYLSKEHQIEVVDPEEY